MEDDWGRDCGVELALDWPEFELPEAPRPRATLVVCGNADFGAGIARIEGIESAPDGPVDARLDPLDLRGCFRAIELEVVDEDGAPIPRFQVSFFPTGHEFDPCNWRNPGRTWARPRQRVFENGRATLATLHDALDVAIVAPGRSAVRLDGLAASQRVVLTPARTVHVRLAEGLVPPRTGVVLGATFVEDRLSKWGGSVGIPPTPKRVEAWLPDPAAGGSVPFDRDGRVALDLRFDPREAQPLALGELDVRDGARYVVARDEDGALVVLLDG